MAELEFRDGIHYVPDHLADLMSDLDTHTLSLTEATDQANQRLVRDRLNRIQYQVVTDHFRELRGE